MATWQFDFHLIPAHGIRKHFGTVPVTIAPEEFDRVNWWVGSDLQVLQQELSSLLPRAPSWNEEIEVRGEEGGNRFDLICESGEVVEVFGRIDVRSMSLPHIERVVAFARKLDLLFLTEDRHLLRPSFRELVSAIRRSRSFAFVRDPEAFLEQIGRRLESES